MNEICYHLVWIDWWFFLLVDVVTLRFISNGKCLLLVYRLNEVRNFETIHSKVFRCHFIKTDPDGYWSSFKLNKFQKLSNHRRKWCCHVMRFYRWRLQIFDIKKCEYLNNIYVSALSGKATVLAFYMQQETMQK